LPSGYQRDLQLIKRPVPLDRLCHESLDIMAAAIPDLLSAQTAFEWIPTSTPRPRPMQMVAEEGIPFREAYRRVGAKYRKVSSRTLTILRAGSFLRSTWPRR
jgi:argininosuccinate lyase